MLTRILSALVLAMLTVSVAFGRPTLALPDLGSGSLRLIGGYEEEDIGRSIVNELRRSNLILEDPELAEYLEHLGARLVAGVDTDNGPFTFFIVKDDSVNAFALPGGYIGIHSGLFLRTRTESELASVVAHEIAHVTQRHIARRYKASAGMSLKGIAMLLGAIALAASGADGDDVSGALMLGQGLMLQDRINFTRVQEYEADRVGLGILVDGGFNPQGMVGFFETMQRIQRLQNSRMPEFLSTHPLSLSRVAEAAQRIQSMEGGKGPYTESRAYPLMKARLAVLSDVNPMLVNGLGENGNEMAVRYARALELMHDGEPETAVRILHELRAEDDSVTNFHVALGRALLQAGDVQASLAAFERAATLFPDSIPVGLAYAEALERNGEPEKALARLRDLFSRRDPQPEHVRSMAQLAVAAGEPAESHYYMSEYYLRMGDLGSARMQLRLAYEQSDPATNAHMKYKARLDEVSAVLLGMRQQASRSRQTGDRDR